MNTKQIILSVFIGLIITGCNFVDKSELNEFFKPAEEYNIYHVAYQCQESNTTTSFSVNSCDVKISWSTSITNITPLIYKIIKRETPNLSDKNVVITSITFLGRKKIK